MCNRSTLLSLNPKKDFLRSLLISKENGKLSVKADVWSRIILVVRVFIEHQVCPKCGPEKIALLSIAVWPPNM